MDPRIWRGNFFNVKKVVYSEAGFPAGNFVASPPPNLLRRHALATVSFPAPLRGHIAQRFAICLRTPFFPRIIFFRYVPFDKLCGRALAQQKTAAPCACRRGARMLHSSWAWRCFSPPLSCQPVQRHGWIFPKQAYAAV